MNNNAYRFGQRKEGAKEHVVSQERLEQIREQRKCSAAQSCKFCGADDNNFRILNQETWRYSLVELALNRQGMLRVRTYPSPDLLEDLQEVIQVPYCPMCGRKF